MSKCPTCGAPVVLDMDCTLMYQEPPTPAKDGMSERELLRNAEMFLRIGADYAPDQSIEDQNKATGEWLKTRGLATTMLRVADAIKEKLAAYEGKEGGK